MPTLTLTRKNATTNEVCIDDVDYEIDESVGIFKDKLRHKLSIENHYTVVLSVSKELPRTSETRELTDEEIIGNCFPKGGAAELGLRGKDEKQEVGGYIMDSNHAAKTATQNSVISMKDLASAKGKGSISRNRADDEASQLNLMTDNSSVDFLKLLLQK